MIPSLKPVATSTRQAFLACPHAREAAIRSHQTRLERFEQMPNITPKEINARQAFLDFLINAHKRMSGENLN